MNHPRIGGCAAGAGEADGSSTCDAAGDNTRAGTRERSNREHLAVQVELAVDGCSTGAKRRIATSLEGAGRRDGRAAAVAVAAGQGEDSRAIHHQSAGAGDANCDGLRAGVVDGQRGIIDDRTRASSAIGDSITQLQSAGIDGRSTTVGVGHSEHQRTETRLGQALGTTAFRDDLLEGGGVRHRQRGACGQRGAVTCVGTEDQRTGARGAEAGIAADGDGVRNGARGAVVIEGASVQVDRAGAERALSDRAGNDSGVGTEGQRACTDGGTAAEGVGTRVDREAARRSLRQRARAADDARAVGAQGDVFRDVVKAHGQRCHRAAHSRSQAGGVVVEDHGEAIGEVRGRAGGLLPVFRTCVGAHVPELVFLASPGEGTGIGSNRRINGVVGGVVSEGDRLRGIVGDSEQIREAGIRRARNAVADQGVGAVGEATDILKVHRSRGGKIHHWAAIVRIQAADGDDVVAGAGRGGQLEDHLPAVGGEGVHRQRADVAGRRDATVHRARLDGAASIEDHATANETG